MVREYHAGERNNNGESVKTTRRSYLGGVTGITYSALHSKITSNNNLKGPVTITTVKANGKPIKTKQVPRDWWAHEQKAKLIRSRLADELADVPGFEGIGLGTEKDRISSRYISNIIVYASQNGIDASLPSNIEGVPVRIEDKQRIVPHSCNTNFHDPMPGGVTVGDGIRSGTACCKVVHDGYYQMLTAAHLFYSSESECYSPDIGGEKAYHSGEYFGRIGNYNLSDDWVTIIRYSDGSINSYDNEIADTTGILSGHVTENGLTDMKSTGETAYLQGVTSCRESGTVDKLDVAGSDGCNIDTNYVSLTTNEADGDSGGPHFKQYTYNGCYYLAIIGVHGGALTASGNSAAYAAYKLANKSTPMEFDPDYQLGYCK